MDNCCAARPSAEPPQRGSADACKPPSRHDEGVSPLQRANPPRRREKPRPTPAVPTTAEPPQRGSAARSPSEPAPPQRKTPPPHACCVNRRRAATPRVCRQAPAPPQRGSVAKLSPRRRAPRHRDGECRLLRGSAANGSVLPLPDTYEDCRQRNAAPPEL